MVVFKAVKCNRTGRRAMSGLGLPLSAKTVLLIVILLPRATSNMTQPERNGCAADRKSFMKVIQPSRKKAILQDGKAVAMYW